MKSLSFKYGNDCLHRANMPTRWQLNDNSFKLWSQNQSMMSYWLSPSYIYSSCLNHAICFYFLAWAHCTVLKKHLIHIYSWHKFESQSAGACVSVLECHCVSVSGTLIRPSRVKPSLRSSWEINLSRFLRGQPLYASLPPTAVTQCIQNHCLPPSNTTHTYSLS